MPAYDADVALSRDRVVFGHILLNVDEEPLILGMGSGPGIFAYVRSRDEVFLNDENGRHAYRRR